MAKAETDGTELIARVAMGACAILLLVIYFADWHAPELFVITLGFLTVGAIAR
jgi:hypothetical protein